MPYKEFQENLQTFANLIDQLSKIQNEQLSIFINRYIEQNVGVLNDFFSISIEHLKKLQQAKNMNDIICTQAKFTQEISKKLTLSAQRFLNASLGNIADYNEWLKAHCDLATD